MPSSPAWRIARRRRHEVTVGLPAATRTCQPVVASRVRPAMPWRRRDLVPLFRVCTGSRRLPSGVCIIRAKEPPERPAFARKPAGMEAFERPCPEGVCAMQAMNRGKDVTPDLLWVPVVRAPPKFVAACPAAGDGKTGSHPAPALSPANTRS
jgi:hypothetical protein